MRHGSAIDRDTAPVLTAAGRISQFETHGFLVLDQLTSAEEVRDLQRVYDRLFEDGRAIEDRDRVELADGSGAVPVLPQILNPERYAPELVETTAYANAFAVARQLLGDDVQHMGMHAIRKPAYSAAETPWHQDEAYWDPAYNHRAISVWLPLQAVSTDNGCMQFLPGTHKDQVREHELINPDSADGLRATRPGDLDDAVACPLRAGGATIHHSRTMHYTGPNTTGEPRRALIMAFRIPPTLRNDSREFPWQPAAWYDD